MNKNKIIINIFSWLFVAIAIGIIVYFATQNGEASSKTSSGVVDTIIESLPNSENITEEQKITIHISVRQLAHFSIYLLLGFSLANALKWTLNCKKCIYILLSFAFSVQFSLFDEFVMQQNTSGRGAELKDVLTDSAGALIGIMCFSTILLIIELIIKIIKRKSLK